MRALVACYPGLQPTINDLLLSAPEQSLFLKSIDITGFKSFARSTHFDFPPGITALVGPNGSGKSNVVDAIRWSLGEQSIRDLRGQRAEDVIHSGARRSLGMAEVQLTFAARDVDDEGTTIARRLYRSGESEYLIDGRRVRLRDVQDALRRLGIDGSRFVVVNQGMTDALLSATPAERRTVLEQAAGLAGYRSRRDDARQKLGSTDANVQLIDTVLAELEPRLRTLRRQARAVEDRDEARNHLRGQLEAWYSHRWATLKGRSEAMAAEILDLGQRRTAAASDLANREATAEAEAAIERDWNATLAVASRALHEAHRAHDAARFSLRELEQRLERTQTQCVEMEQALDSVQRALVTAREGRQSLITRLQVLVAESERTEMAQAAATQVLQAAEPERKRWAAALHDLTIHQQADERDHRAALTDVELHDRMLHDNEHGLDTIVERRRTVNKELEVLRREMAGLASELDVTGRAELDAITARRMSASALESALLRVRRLADLALRARRRLQEAERHHHLLRNRLAEIDRDVAGTILSDLRAQPGWEVAVASALGPWTTSGALRTGNDARQGSVHVLQSWRNELAQDRPGLLWADQVTSGWPDSVANPLATSVLVSTDDNARDLWAHLRIRSALALGSPPLQIVTQNGRVYSALGILEGRTAASAEEPLTLRNEEALARRRVVHTRQRADRLADGRQPLALEQLRREKELSEADAAVDHAIRAHATLKQRNEEVQRRVSRLTHDLEHFDSQETSLLAASEAIQQRKVQLEVRISEAATRVAQRSPAIRQAQDAVGALDARVAAAKVDSSEAKRAAEITRVRRDGEERALRSAEQEIARLDGEHGRLTAQIPVLQTSFESLIAGILERKAEVESLANEVAQRQVVVDSLQANPPAPGIHRGSILEMRDHLQSSVTAHERLVVVAEALAEERDRLAIDMKRDLGFAPHELPLPTGAPPTEDELRRLRARATQYADVDTGVVQECAELTERYSNLRRHREDLGAAAAGLREIMLVADREMRLRFRTAFDAVNEEFGRVFTVMLRGGAATLEVVDDDGGVGIRAQLPGKRISSSGAFSGGERALVASSLLFGVLRIRPAPFCVLDEVDAALDEGNVDRYLAALHDISRQTQIIVVTHNRATMAAARALYGLTMDREGVSNMLSLQLDTYEVAG